MVEFWSAMMNMSATSLAHLGHSLTRSFAILIFPGFPMMAFSSVIEPLRAANTLSGETLYEWSLVGGERGVIRASNGIAVTPD